MLISWNRFQNWAVYALNVVSVIFMVYTTIVLIRQHASAKEEVGRAPGILLTPGKLFPLTSVDWRKRHFTLVFALSSGCHFCAESAPFYRELLRHRGEGDWQALAVLPQTVEVSSAYMRSQGYSISDTRQADFESLGVSATPTLMLVDSEGRFQQSWVGKLNPSEISDVLLHLGVQHWSQPRDLQPAEESSGASSPLVTTQESLALLSENKRVNVLDVRDRLQFHQSHVHAALNIPIDELDVRSRHEIQPTLPTLMYCNFSNACDRRGIASLCSQAAGILRDNGIPNVRIFRDPLPLLADAGVRVDSSN